MTASDADREPPVLVHRGIPYRETDARTLGLDVYRPRNAIDSDGDSSADRPVVLFVYGGGWSAGATGQFARYALAFAAAGWVAVECSYRLADETAFPAQIVDVHAALDWLGEHAREYGGDADRLAVVGHSAGGHLAALASVTRDHSELTPAPASRSGSRPTIAAVAGISGVYDFDLSEAAREDFADPLAVPDGERSLAEQRRIASPVSHVSAGDPPSPTLLLHGADDAVVSTAQSERYRDVLEAAGATVDFEIVPGADHVFLHSAGEYPATRDRLLAFFEDRV